MDGADQIYNRLIAPIEDAMMGAVSRIVHDPHEAADVFQEVLAEVWVRLPRIDRHPNPHAYIMRICVSRSYDALRRRARKREVAIESAPEARAGDAAGAGLDGTYRAIVDAIAALPPKQGQAVLLRATRDAGYHEIADALGCAPATARSHVAKGLERLRRTLRHLGMP